MTTLTPDLYEGICRVSRFPGCLHVPLIRHRGRWLNAITGHQELWVRTVEPMAPDRAKLFADGARYIITRSEE